MSVLDRRRYLKYLGGTLVLVGLGVAVYSLIILTPGPSYTSLTGADPSKGNFAPEFSLYDLSGESISLRDLHGKPVVLNFWATWCAPCVIEMPNLQKFYEIYTGEFEILAVDADEPEKVIKRFIDEIGVTFKVLLDPGAEIQDLYRIRGYPSTFFVDAEGVIQAVHIGMLTEKQIADYLLALGIEP